MGLEDALLWGSLRGCGQEALNPHHVGFSVWLLECLHAKGWLPLEGVNQERTEEENHNASFLNYFFSFINSKEMGREGEREGEKRDVREDH